MIHLFLQEFKRIFFNKKLIVFELFLLFTNTILLLWFSSSFNNKSYLSEDYKTAWKHIKENTNYEETLNEYNEKNEEIIFNSAFSNEDDIKFYLYDKKLINDIIEELSIACLRTTIINQLLENVSKMSKIGLFDNTSSFRYRNALQLREKYNDINRNPIIPQPSKAFVLSFENNFTDFLILVAMLGVVFILFFVEKDNRLNTLFKTMYYGKSFFYICKIIILFLYSLFFSFIFSFTGFIISGSVYGFPSIFSSIHAIVGHEYSVVCLNVVEYGLLKVLYKSLSLFAFSLVFSLFIILINKTTVLLYAICAFVGIEMFIYYYLSDTSRYAFLKYLNFYTTLKNNTIIDDVIYLDFLGFPISYKYVSLLFIMIFIVFVIVGILFIIEKNITFSGKIHQNIKKSKFVKNNKFCIKNPFIFELYKDFINGKWMVVVILFFVINILFVGSEQKAFSTIDEFYYYNYITDLSGTIDEKKVSFVKSELNYISSLKDELVSSNDGFRIAYISKELKKENALNMINSKINYLMSIENGGLFYEKGYELLTEKKGLADKKDILLAIEAVLLLSICISYVINVEYKIGMNKILYLTKYGKKKILRDKVITSLMFSAIVFCIIYIPNVCFIFNKFESGALNYSARSLYHLNNVPGFITIGGYITFVMMKRIFALMIISLSILFMSRYIKTQTGTFVVSILVFTIPLVLCYLRFELMRYFFINIFLI